MSQDPLIGRLVAGRYRVVRLIGTGGMGRVYVAEQDTLGRMVALKILRKERLARPGPHHERFAREARTASKVNHPGLATIYDFGEWEGTLYLAMEFLRGVSLAGVIERRGALPGVPTARILIQVCDVLQVTHAAGILHRDLKPENIMLVKGPDGREQAKVVDFGLSLLLQSTETRLTREGLVTGTPAYMAPEQCRGKKQPLDPRVDVYAVGVVLYEMLCGQIPFDGDNPSDILLGHLFEDPVPPSDRRPDRAVPPSLEALCLWAMAKEPADRPPSAKELKDEFEDALALMLREREARKRGVVDPAVAQKSPGTPAESPQTDDDARVTLHEPAGRPLGRSLLPLLRSHNVATHRARDLAQELARETSAPLVLDLGDDPQATFEQLAPILPAGDKPHRPVVVVGPEQDIAVMTRALELGLSDYVARTDANPKLLKSLKRLNKKAMRQKKR